MNSRKVVISLTGAYANGLTFDKRELGLIAESVKRTLSSTGWSVNSVQAIPAHTDQPLYDLVISVNVYTIFTESQISENIVRDLMINGAWLDARVAVINDPQRYTYTTNPVVTGANVKTNQYVVKDPVTTNTTVLQIPANTTDTKSTSEFNDKLKLQADKLGISVGTLLVLGMVGILAIMRR